MNRDRRIHRIAEPPVLVAAIALCGLAGCTIGGAVIGGLTAWRGNRDIATTPAGPTPFWCGAHGSCFASAPLCRASDDECAPVQTAWCASRRDATGETRFSCRATEATCTALDARVDACATRQLAPTEPRAPHSVAAGIALGAVIGLVIDVIAIQALCDHGCDPR